MAWAMTRRLSYAISLSAFVVLIASRVANAVCAGDCNGLGTCSIGEVQKCANIYLGTQLVSSCYNCDRNGNGVVSIGEVQAAANCYLSIGCLVVTPPATTPTVATPSPTNTPEGPTPTPTNTPVTPATPTNTPVTPSPTPVTPSPTPITPSATPVTPSATPTATNTLPVASPTPSVTPPPPTATVTPTSPGGVVTPNICGNRTPEPANGETCDQGGTCVGGSNAGTPCNNETQCTGNGVCDVGPKYGTNCTGSADCGGVACIHCKTFGGNGCAANCTAETDVVWNQVKGVIVSGKCKASTSCANLVAGLTLPLPLNGSQTLTVGKKGTNGMVPFVVKADTVSFDRIPISTIACACVRGIAAKTCGGYLFETDGTPPTDCTFDDTCAAAGKPPCAYVNGPGNGAAGVVGCGTGSFSPINVMTTQNAGGIQLPAPPSPQPTASPPIVTLSSSGATGSAIEINSIRLGSTATVCAPQGADPAIFGPDGEYCTPDDPDTVVARGPVSTVVSVTGQAMAKLTNAFALPNPVSIPPDPTPGNFVTGKVFNCTKLTAANPTLTGAGLASAFTLVQGGVPGSGTVTNVQFAQ